MQDHPITTLSKGGIGTAGAIFGIVTNPNSAYAPIMAFFTFLIPVLTVANLGFQLHKNLREKREMDREDKRRKQVAEFFKAKRANKSKHTRKRLSNES